ncbi:MAG: hypothetical protein ABIG44_14495 [Planctomycetota bacterium]
MTAEKKQAVPEGSDRQSSTATEGGRYDVPVNRARRLWWRLGCVVAVVLVAGTAVCLTYMLRNGEDDGTALKLLRSDDPERRKLGAWLTADEPSATATEFMAKALREGQESSADVRESYLYALGRSQASEHFSLVASLSSNDPSGYVRQAAWLAMARMDEERFRKLADQANINLAAREVSTGQAWDQLGLANAYLRIGDTRSVTTILHWAQHGDADQKLVACGALHKGLAPYLEVVGRWPLGSEVTEGQIWPPALLQELAQRCEALDLQAIADDSRPILEDTRLVLRDIHRLTSARTWITWMLSSF